MAIFNRGGLCPIRRGAAETKALIIHFFEPHYTAAFCSHTWKTRTIHTYMITYKLTLLTGIVNFGLLLLLSFLKFSNPLRVNRIANRCSVYSF
jgi:hypothetical protein